MTPYKRSSESLALGHIKWLLKMQYMNIQDSIIAAKFQNRRPDFKSQQQMTGALALEIQLRINITTWYQKDDANSP